MLAAPPSTPQVPCGAGTSFVARIFFHDALDKVVEDLEFAVERFDKFFVWLNPHDNLREFIVPTQDIDPASLGDVKLILQLGPEASPTPSENTRFECVITGL